MKTACFVLLVAVVATSVAAQKPIDPLDEMFRRARAAQASLVNVSAAFTETTVSSLLREPAVADGTIVAAQPMRVVMHYKTPVAKTVWLDARRLVIVWPGRGEHEELDIASTQKRVQKYFVDATAKDLRQSFDISLSSDAALNNADLMDMTPTRKQIREGLSRLRIWIDPVRLVMLKMRMDYADGDVRTLTFHDIVLNGPIDQRIFVMPPKAGGGGLR